MTQHRAIQTDKAPAAIGPYSQAVQAGNTLYLSGQIPLDPTTMELIPSADFAEHARQVFKNLAAVLDAAGLSLEDVVKLNLYLVDLGQFAAVNAVMEEFFSQPFPARAAIGVASLPKGAVVEADAIAVVPTA
nr:RidA family protein [Oceanococcus sp. HetDA_MAG_MS8]